MDLPVALQHVRVERAASARPFLIGEGAGGKERGDKGKGNKPMLK